MAEKIKTIKEIAQKILDLLGVKAQINLQEKESVVNLQIETEEPGILIGYHGRALQSLQLLISLICFKKFNEWLRIVVDVGDYRGKRQEALTKMAQSLAQKVKFSGMSQSLPPMSASERRIIHLALANDSEVETFSEGEGSERRVVIRLKS